MLAVDQTICVELLLEVNDYLETCSYRVDYDDHKVTTGTLLLMRNV